MPLLPCIEKEPETAANAAVIWLHGLGADGNDFVPIIPTLSLPASMAVRFVFPNAPSIPITINGGYVMPAWYDITAMDIDRTVDKVQLIESAEQVRRLIEREVERGIPSDRIVLAGFSQGGAVAFQTALTHTSSLAGLLCLSTYFATAETLNPSDANRQIPIRICHGTGDPMVSVALGKRACRQLTDLGYAVEYSEYPMEHEVCSSEIADISRWLQQRLA